MDLDEDNNMEQAQNFEIPDFMSAWTDKEKAGNLQLMQIYNTIFKLLFYRICFSTINYATTKCSFSNHRSHFTLLASQYFISEQKH
jgi:hypothetical protein